MFFSDEVGGLSDQEQRISENAGTIDRRENAPGKLSSCKRKENL
jgi:hypothetical protein